MPAADRTPCINPACRRTAPRKPDETEIICGKCFRALPQALRQRYRALGRREKCLLRLAERRIARGAIDGARIRVIAGLIERGRLQNWQAIRSYYTSSSKPAGLDGFLREVGL